MASQSNTTRFWLGVASALLIAAIIGGLAKGATTIERVSILETQVGIELRNIHQQLDRIESKLPAPR